MTLFDLSQLIVFVLITLIIITGSILLLMITETIIYPIINIIKNKKAFDKAYPVGSLFTTRIEQKMPYGKWKLLGQNQHGIYLYERTK